MQEEEEWKGVLIWDEVLFSIKRGNRTLMFRCTEATKKQLETGLLKFSKGAKRVSLTQCDYSTVYIKSKEELERIKNKMEAAKEEIQMLWNITHNVPGSVDTRLN